MTFVVCIYTSTSLFDVRESLPATDTVLTTFPMMILLVDSIVDLTNPPKSPYPLPISPAHAHHPTPLNPQPSLDTSASAIPHCRCHSYRKIKPHHLHTAPDRFSWPASAAVIKSGVFPRYGPSKVPRNAACRWTLYIQKELRFSMRSMRRVPMLGIALYACLAMMMAIATRQILFEARRVGCTLLTKYAD